MLTENKRWQRPISEKVFKKLMERQVSWADVTDYMDVTKKDEPWIITPTKIPGLAFIHHKQHRDKRGSFQMLWQLSDVKNITGKDVVFKQGNHSRTITEDETILRGLHAENEYKLIKPMKGNMLAVFVDLRKWSRTFLEYEIIRFERDTMSEPVVTVLIPPGVANSIFAYSKPGQKKSTLEYLYTISEEYNPKDAGMGVRFDDVELAIPWPDDNPVISERDKNMPTLQEFLEKYGHVYRQG